MTPEIKTRMDQIQRGRIPEGYRKVKKNIFPIKWEYRPLSDIVSISQGYTFSRELQGKSEGDWNYFKVADIGLSTNTKYLRKAVNMIDDTVAKSMGATPFEAGSIVFPRVGAALFNNNKKIIAQDSIVDDNVLVITIRNKKFCNNEFLYYALLLVRLEDWCNSGLVPVINSKTVLKYQVCLPTLFEQQKIAEILTTQDKVIELKEKRLAETQRQKKYLMQQLLTGKKRLPRFNEKWKKKRFCEVFTFGTTNTFSREYMCEDSTGVKNIHYGDILVRYGEILKLSEQEIPALLSEAGSKITSFVDDGDVVIADTAEDLTAGKVIEIQETQGKKVAAGLHTMLCKPMKDCFAFGWLGYYMNSEHYHKQLIPYIAGIKVMSISKGNIVKTNILVPSIAEQTAIVQVLSTADRELDLLRQDIEQEKQKKKALMQLLLTGIVRVSV